MIGKPKMKKLVDYGVFLKGSAFFEEIFAKTDPLTG
jgi:hypothetical protein